MLTWKEVCPYCCSIGLVATVPLMRVPLLLIAVRAMFGNLPFCGRGPRHGPSVPAKVSVKSPMAIPPLLPLGPVTGLRFEPDPWFVKPPGTFGALVALSPIFEFVSVVPKPPTTSDRFGKLMALVSVTSLVIPAEIPEVALKIGLPPLLWQGT